MAVSTKWPSGLRSSGVSAGIKSSGALDLGLLASERAATWAGAFTCNAAAASCVHWCRAALGRPVRAVVVNSGNANACTGARGRATVESTAADTAATLGCAVDEVLVCSTGPIGVPLDAALLSAALGPAAEGLSPDTADFSHALLTTDTHAKVATSSAGPASVVGVAKGAAMLAPNMATMLAFIGTDATVDPNLFQDALSDAVEQSFNRLSIDSCESTNDSVIALATGAGPAADEAELRSSLFEVCRELALKIARDAEGATKLIRIRVAGAHDEAHAVALGKAVAASNLWSAAAHGADPNWGRVLSAMGSLDRSLDLASTSVAIGDEVVFKSGEPVGFIARAAATMRSNEFTVTVGLAEGESAAEVLTTDLSEEYVTLNAEVTT